MRRRSPAVIALEELVCDSADAGGDIASIAAITGASVARVAEILRTREDAPPAKPGAPGTTKARSPRQLRSASKPRSLCPSCAGVYPTADHARHVTTCPGMDLNARLDFLESL